MGAKRNATKQDWQSDWTVPAIAYEHVLRKAVSLTQRNARLAARNAELEELLQQARKRSAQGLNLRSATKRNGQGIGLAG